MSFAPDSVSLPLGGGGVCASITSEKKENILASTNREKETKKGKKSNLAVRKNSPDLKRSRPSITTPVSKRREKERREARKQVL